MYMRVMSFIYFFFSSRRRHTRCSRDWSSDVCSSDLVRPVVERLPDTGLGRFGGDPLDVGLEVRIRGNRNFQVTRQIVEDPRHIRGALNVGVAAESVYAAARAPDVAKQQLQHGGGADGLWPRRMLRPA